MNYSLIFVPIIFTLASCSTQNERVEAPVSESFQFSSRVRHNYTFNSSGDIETKKSITYYYSRGILIDSIPSTEKLIYNSKGLVIRVENEYEKEYRFYNEVDSLIGEYIIKATGDTTTSKKYLYEHGRIKSRIQRYLTPRINDVDPTQIRIIKDYDTTFYSLDYEYPIDTLEICFERDIKNELISETHTTFKNGRKTKATLFKFLGIQRYIFRTTFYDKKPNTKYVDYFVVNSSGDTTDLQKTFFKDSIRIVGVYMAEAETQDYSFYNKQNQLIRWIVNDLANQRRDIFTYLYDSKGYLIEETDFHERIAENLE